MATRAKYKGDGSEYYNGIPARDLSDEEYEALDKDQKRLVGNGKLYEMADAKPKAAAPSGAAAPAALGKEG